MSLGKVRQFENEMLKIGNWFTVFIFGKLKKNFRSKGKCFPLTIILRLSKHRKIRKSFSWKPFYVEVNGAFVYVSELVLSILHPS